MNGNWNFNDRIAADCALGGHMVELPLSQFASFYASSHDMLRFPLADSAIAPRVHAAANHQKIHLQLPDCQLEREPRTTGSLRRGLCFDRTQHAHE